jgi:hypothetical protein
VITNILWAVLGGLASLVNAWLGYKFAGAEMSHHKRQRIDLWFVICGLVGVLSIGVVTYRASQVERAHFATKMTNVYVTPSFLVANRPLAFNVEYKNVGNGSASKVKAIGLASIQADESTASQRLAISEFKRYRIENLLEETLQKDQEKYITAYGPTLSAEDVTNIMIGKKVVYVVADITFDDDFGSHAQHVCQLIEPIVPERQFEIWSDCHQYNSEEE